MASLTFLALSEEKSLLTLSSEPSGGGTSFGCTSAGLLSFSLSLTVCQLRSWPKSSEAVTVPAVDPSSKPH